MQDLASIRDNLNLRCQKNLTEIYTCPYSGFSNDWDAELACANNGTKYFQDLGYGDIALVTFGYRCDKNAYSKVIRCPFNLYGALTGDNKCTDSDGLSPFVKGFVTASDKYGSYVLNDTCTYPGTNNYVVEPVCYTNGSVGSYYLNCSSYGFGYKCTDGACRWQRD